MDTFKKFRKVIFILALVVVLAAALSACDNGGKGAHTLSFVVEGYDASIPSIEAKAGEAITPPADPTRDGYTFDGWYLDAACEGAKTTLPTVMPDEDVTYYAKFVKDPTYVSYTVELYLQKLNADLNGVLDEYELGNTLSGSGLAGATYSPSDVRVDGFFAVDHEGEVATLTLDEDASKNVYKLYFDRVQYIISFDGNGGAGSMADVRYPHGGRLDGSKVNELFPCEYSKGLDRFIGWAGFYTATESNAVPTTLFEVKADITYIAIWHKGYRGPNEDSEIVYGDGTYYYRLTGGVRETAEPLGGLDGVYDQFAFDHGESDELVCRVYAGSDVYVVRGEEYGNYLRYDYIYDAPMNMALALDGFGYGTIDFIDAADGIGVLYSGTYEYDPEYDDYALNVEGAEDPEAKIYFALVEYTIEGAEGMDGFFLIQGSESSEYYAKYNVRESAIDENSVLQLNGYGAARLMNYDAATDDYVTFDEGAYFGTQLYQDFLGEWRYESDDEEGDVFDFILTYSGSGNNIVYLYMEYDDTLDVVLHAADGDGTLTLSGYNGASYKPSGASADDAIVGAISFATSETILLTVYGDDPEDVTDVITFRVDFENELYTLDESGFIIDENGVLTSYVGRAGVVVIPDGVTEIAERAFANSSVPITQVTIPSTVERIGAKAFENNYTLVRVTFLADEPITIDWAAENDPFRWPSSGDFRIFVPNNSLSAYREKFEADGCKYTVTSVAEYENRPEFEVVDGVLVAYNNKTEDPHDVEIAIPDDVTEIADMVFRNCTYIKSVDLNAVTKVGASAFEGCSALTSVTADNLSDIGDAAFALCVALTEISLPSARVIGAEAFSGCETLTDVTVGASISQIKLAAFSSCALYPRTFTLNMAEGTAVPIMEHAIGAGGSVFYATSTVRISVENVADALRLYDATSLGWSNYASHITVREAENSSIAGSYVDMGTLSPAEIGGRLEVSDATYIYSLDGGALTLYAYDGDTATYATINGTVSGGRVRFGYNGATFVLVKREGTLAYTSTKGDGGRLEVDLDSYFAGFEENSDGTSTYKTYANCTLNGDPAVLNISASGSVSVRGLKDEDGINMVAKMRLSVSGNNGAYTLTSQEWDDITDTYTADDGSYIKIRYSGKSRYLVGSLMQLLNDKGLPIVIDDDSSAWYVLDVTGNAYTASVNYFNDRYYVTVRIDEATKRFTYELTLAATREVLTGTGGSVVLLISKAGAIEGISLLISDGADGTVSLYCESFELQSDGSYLVTVNVTEPVYNPATEGYDYQPSPFNGTYKITINRIERTCTIMKN